MKTDNIVRAPNKDQPSLKSLEERLDNIDDRIETLRDNLRGCIEQAPMSGTEKDKSSSSPTLDSLNRVAGQIQTTLSQCEELISTIKSG